VLLCDTSGLIAYFDASDGYHADVSAAIDAEPGPFAVSPYVLAEVGYLLATRRGVREELLAVRELSGGAWELPAFDSGDVSAGSRHCRTIRRSGHRACGCLPGDSRGTLPDRTAADSGPSPFPGDPHRVGKALHTGAVGGAVTAARGTSPAPRAAACEVRWRACGRRRREAGAGGAAARTTGGRAVSLITSPFPHGLAGRGSSPVGRSRLCPGGSGPGGTPHCSPGRWGTAAAMLAFRRLDIH
jgi:hypothetical protein